MSSLHPHDTELSSTQPAGACRYGARSTFKSDALDRVLSSSLQQRRRRLHEEQLPVRLQGLSPGSVPAGVSVTAAQRGYRRKWELLAERALNHSASRTPRTLIDISARILKRRLPVLTFRVKVAGADRTQAAAASTRELPREERIALLQQCGGG